MAKKSGLGRGLGSLMGETNGEVSGGRETSTLPLKEIKPNKDQPRKQFDERELSELTESIRKNGVLQPILVRQKGTEYEIVAGERRYQAAKLAGLDEIPVLIREISDEDSFTLALIENLQRSDLNPIEEAKGYKKLLDRDNLTQEELGNLLSKSRSAIANTLRLLDLPQEIQDYMTDGMITAGHARAILAVAGDEGKRRLAEKVIQENLTVRQTENLAPLFSGEGKQSRKREATPQSFKRAARELRMALNRNVQVKRVRNKNKIEIEFVDEDDLARLMRALGPVEIGGSEQ